MTYAYNGFGAAPARSFSPLLAKLNDAWSKMDPKAPIIGKSLASLATALEALYLLHQSAHWQTRGASYYGDHLMFQRLYKGIDKEIDSLGERAVAMGSPLLVCPITTAHLSAKVLPLWGKGHSLDSPEKLVMLSLNAEKSVLEAVASAMATASPSDGVQNLLQGIADAHEGNIYLLQQRLAGAR